MPKRFIPQISYSELRRLYTEEEKSTYEIAAIYGRYANYVNRCLNFYNIPLRNKAAAQTIVKKKEGMKNVTRTTKENCE